MKSSCGSNWGFWIFDLEFFHLRRASTAFSKVARLTLAAEEGGGDSIRIFLRLRLKKL